MKFLNKSIYALSLLSVMGLWSCSNDEFVQEGGQDLQGHLVSVTLTVNRGESQTRTELSENTVTGGLVSKWIDGDKLYVYNDEGTEIGYLDLVEIPDQNQPSVGIFKGNVQANEGVNNLNVWYYNDKATKYISVNDSKKQIRIVLNEQDFTDAASLAAVEVMGQKVKLNVGNEGTATVEESTTMQPKLAMARFSLKGLPEGTTGDLRIYDADKKATNTVAATLNTLECNVRQPLVTPGAATSGTEKGKDYAYNVRNVKAGEDIFVALVPRSQALRYGFEYTTTDNVVYTYEFKTGTVIEAGKYYNAGVVDGKIQGASVTFVDHTKNPLLKWAEGNLIYDKASKTSSISTDPYATGSLYQWGRNVGFDDWKDARGDYDAYYNDYSYVVVDISEYDCNGFGKPGLNKNDIIQPSTYWNIDDANDMEGIKDLWIMNGNPNGSNGDYWIWSGGGTSWETRAEACGYGKSTPCPQGYKMPTVADYESIMPKEDIVDATQSLKDNLSQSGEIRTLEDKTTYAIKWRIENKALQIAALVVPKDTKIDAVDWDNDEVVTRIFPFSGMIRSTTADQRLVNMNSYNGWWTVLQSPLPIGDIVVKGNTYTAYGYKFYYNTWNILADYSDKYAGYWVSDQKSTFTFVEREGWNNAQMNQQGVITGSSNLQSSQLKMTTQNAHNGYAIRCIKVESN